MNNTKRPLPRTDEYDTQRFWEATKDKEFRYQQCDSCETIVFYPRRHCTGCTNGSLAWKVSAGTGTVYTFSVVRQSYHPFFRNLVPYAVAWIDLDEGPRILSNVVGVPPEEVAIGQRVQIEWEEHEELNIPLFKPMVA
ncbi:MAG: Zn-ribbon domain-containing OB-fold protein [bacterium]|nr:Zn-ribbon domain-containing OB-fold protein [Gammaproteobacteria bacterium]HIL95265.1 Zn-ribbon domain-containing OB-fold protein [Pseudomonadales bacterium]